MRRKYFLVVLVLVLLPLLIASNRSRLDSLVTAIATLCPSANCWGAAAALTATGALDVDVVGCSQLDSSVPCAADFPDYVVDNDTIVSGTTTCTREGNRHLEADVTPLIECECTAVDPANLWRCWEAQDAEVIRVSMENLADEKAVYTYMRRTGNIALFGSNTFGATDVQDLVGVVEECDSSGANPVTMGASLENDTNLTPPTPDTSFTNASFEAGDYLRFRIDSFTTLPEQVEYHLLVIY